jgi:hypothetical protein
MADDPTRSIPRFNHVALTVPADALDEEGRRALLDFYGAVFGWNEMPTLTVDRERLVLRCHSNEQFVYLHADDRPMKTAGSEHIGLSVDTPEELDALYERARARGAGDDEVELTKRGCDDYRAVKLHHFYVRYRLPLQIEVQCFEWAEGAGPFATARSV